MIEISAFLDSLTQYPTNIGFVMFSILFFLMVLSIIFSIGDTEVTSGLDGFNFETVDNILISSGISKVPVVIGLSVTFFFATIISFVFNDLFVYSLGQYLSTFSEILSYLVLGAFFFVYFVVSLYIAGFVLKPVAKLFNIKAMAVDYFAHEWEVISTEVNENYGEVKANIDLLEHRVQVINVTEDKIVYGDKVILKNKINPDSNRYYVELLKKD